MALPKAVGHWSLTTLQAKLIKIGAKVVHHARYVTFQMAAVTVPRNLFELPAKVGLLEAFLPEISVCER